MKKANWFNLAYLILSETTKFIFCFVTTLLSLQFFSSTVTMFPFFQKMLNPKQLGNILTSHSTNNLKPKKPCSQSSIKTFYEGLPGKGRVSWIWLLLLLIYAVVTSFGSSSIVGCSEKASVIKKSFDSYSELVFSSLEMKVLKKKFLLMN